MTLPFKYCTFGNNMGRGLTKKEEQEIIKKEEMKNVKFKCSSCGTEITAVQYEKVKKIQGFCDKCEKNITLTLSKGCGIPMLVGKK